ncbi:hypothetical protein DRQ33_07825, partial [bacterium]
MKYIITLALFNGILFGVCFGQITWIETSQSDFADGYIDPSLYASFRLNSESAGDSGAVEWFARFDIDLNGYPDFISADGGVKVWYMGPYGLDHSWYSSEGIGGNCDVADLNIDGYPELIHSGYGSSNLSIHWNSASGFLPSPTILPNLGSEAVYIADFDRDGYLDVGLAGFTSSVFRVYWGEPGYLYSTDTYTDYSVPGGLVHNIESGDFDGDSDLDIAAIHYGSYGFCALENVGARSFNLLPSSTFPISLSTSAPHGLSVGDLDNDGDIDLVFTGCVSINFSDIFINEGDWIFTHHSVNPGVNYGGSALYDFNGDGFLDIIFFHGNSSATSDEIPIYINDGTGHFSDAASYDATPFGVNCTGGTVIDANHDGNVDIFVNSSSSPSYLFWGPDFTTYESFPIGHDHHGMFREPGNIRDRSPSGWYESNIFDTEYEFGFCSGSVNWIAYDERDYESGSLPNPIGSQVLILARTGDTPIPDVSWTDWDTLTDDSALPVSILGHRYIQYRAELWYSNVAYLPWLEMIEFEFEPCSDETLDLNVFAIPEPGAYDSCDIKIGVWLSCDTTERRRVLWINDFDWAPNGRLDPIYSASSVAYTDWRDSLEFLGFTIHEVNDPIVLTTYLLDTLDIIVLGSTKRTYTPAESAAVWNFISEGGVLFSIAGWDYPSAVWSSHNLLIRQFGIEYYGLYTGATDSVIVSDLPPFPPLSDGLSIIAGGGTYEMHTSEPAFCLWDGTHSCAMSIAYVGCGRIMAFYDEQTFTNGPWHGLDIYTRTHFHFAMNIFRWLSMSSVFPPDTSSAEFIVTDGGCAGIEPTLSLSGDTMIIEMPEFPDCGADVEICLTELSDTMGNPVSGLPLCWRYHCAEDSSELFVVLLYPPQDVYIACDDQVIYFSVEMDSTCDVDSSASWLVIDSTDTFTLDSTWFSLDSLLRFEPDTAYWENGGHWFQLHIEDDCGNVFDSLYGALFDLEPPIGFMLTPAIGAPNCGTDIPPGGLTYDI